ncbi:hypothetical protein BAE44_0023119 [Dichanthelium oligosanthes]|uniref:Phorbol-ester/DAG-type domain-containing protein n=1 Tax=Dichanthelium oligosanthes TaxID=888268 RepID=A0A1E5USK7_9POAL|nr:hypothetical protein BAE44_0023119 [Dichanthelium oligosanthes]
MAAASANATIRSTYYHPQHLLAVCHYSDASTHPCAACERVVTGIGYRCSECGFNIHKACFTGLPRSVSLGHHNGHELTCALTRLDASRVCGVCEEASHAGRYMYLCAALDVPVHPRCVLLMATTTSFHPQHFLSVYNYDDAPTAHPCAACERAVAGIGYRCGECGFNIHRDCLMSFPGSIPFPTHRPHELALTCLPASRCCDVCKRASRAGFYMYLCEPCNYGVHPQCVLDFVSQLQRRRPNRGGRAGRTVLKGLRVVDQVAHTAHSVGSVVDTKNWLHIYAVPGVSHGNRSSSVILRFDPGAKKLAVNVTRDALLPGTLEMLVAAVAASPSATLATPGDSDETWRSMHVARAAAALGGGQREVVRQR